MNPALGSIDKRGNKSCPIRYVATFDEETFAEIRGYALRQKVSVAAAIRELVEWGLAVVDAEEREETPQPLQVAALVRLSAEARTREASQRPAQEHGRWGKP